MAKLNNREGNKWMNRWDKQDYYLFQIDEFIYYCYVYKYICIHKMTVVRIFFDQKCRESAEYTVNTLKWWGRKDINIYSTSQLCVLL